MVSATKDQPSSAAAAPERLTWPVVRENLGTGGVVWFDVNRQGRRNGRRALQYSTRLEATELEGCDEERDIGLVMESATDEDGERIYPAGTYTLTARTGPGPGEYWQPYGAKVHIAVRVGSGAVADFDREQDKDDEDDDDDDDARIGAEEADALSALNAIRVAKVAEREKLDLERLQAERRRLRDEGRGGGLGQLLSPTGIAAALPLFDRIVDWLDRRKTPQDEASRAAIRMVSDQAREVAKMNAEILRDSLGMQLDVIARAQKQALGVKDDEDDDPISRTFSKLLPHLSALGGAGEQPNTATAAPVTTGTSAAPEGAAGSPLRILSRILADIALQPDAETFYRCRLHDAVAMLPAQIRTGIAATLAADGAVDGMHAIYCEILPAETARFDALMGDPSARAWWEDIAALIIRDWLPEGLDVSGEEVAGDE